LHLKNIYKVKELEVSSTTDDSWVVQQEGRRMIKRRVKFYNLSAIISVSYRVNSNEEFNSVNRQQKRLNGGEFEKIGISKFRTPRTARTPRTVRILRSGNEGQKHSNTQKFSKVHFLILTIQKIGSFSAFHIKKKKDHSKTKNTKRAYTAIRATFEGVQNDTIQINLKL
jgi:hypothetical protein